MATMEQNLINNLLASNKALTELLEQAERYIVRKEAFQGCMDAVTLEKAEADYRAHVSRVEIGRWAGDMAGFDMWKARAAVADSRKKYTRLWEAK